MIFDTIPLTDLVHAQRKLADIVRRLINLQSFLDHASTQEGRDPIAGALFEPKALCARLSLAMLHDINRQALTQSDDVYASGPPTPARRTTLG